MKAVIGSTSSKEGKWDFPVRPGRLLVACEFTGRVRDAFLRRGYDAVSCDLLPTEAPGPHIQGDVLEVIAHESFDMMIAFPPCTHLTTSANAWYDKPTKDFPFPPYKRGQIPIALAFVRKLMSAPIPMICIENPVGRISTNIRPPDQVIQPWMFGHDEDKATCLWLKNLPLLMPTKVVQGGKSRILYMPKKDRGKSRSKTYPNIAEAMAEQWGPFLVESVVSGVRRGSQGPYRQDFVGALTRDKLANIQRGLQRFRTFRANENGEAVRALTNLGWLLSNWRQVQSFEIVRNENEWNDAVLIAELRDGTFYVTEFASIDVLEGFLDRPVFRGLPIYWHMPPGSTRRSREQDEGAYQLALEEGSRFSTPPEHFSAKVIEEDLDE